MKTRDAATGRRGAAADRITDTAATTGEEGGKTARIYLGIGVPNRTTGHGVSVPGKTERDPSVHLTINHEPTTVLVAHRDTVLEQLNARGVDMDKVIVEEGADAEEPEIANPEEESKQ